MRRSRPIIIFLYFTAFFSFFMALFFWFYPKKQNRIKVLTMKPGRNMTRADLLYDSTLMTPNAVVVLCPGYNGTGREFLLDEQWQKFAKKNNLGLVVKISCSFYDSSCYEKSKRVPFSKHVFP